MGQHPDGPGALAFYGLCGDVDLESFRAKLLADVRLLWPSDVCVDGRPLEICSSSDIDEEFVQFNCCAAHRVLDYVLSGVVHAHQVRNEDLRQALVAFRAMVAVREEAKVGEAAARPVGCGCRKRPASAVLKRPAQLFE